MAPKTELPTAKTYWNYKRKRMGVSKGFCFPKPKRAHSQENGQDALTLCAGTRCDSPRGPTIKWTSAMSSLLNIKAFLKISTELKIQLASFGIGLVNAISEIKSIFTFLAVWGELTASVLSRRCCWWYSVERWWWSVWLPSRSLQL